AGPWTDELLERLAVPFGRRLLRPTKGVHAVFDHEKLPVTRAVTLMLPDRRVIFCIPWVERTVVGTTDTDFSGDPDAVHADAADVKYLCDAVNRYFADHKVTPDDVIATWAGLRPLVASDAPSASDVSREHEVFVRPEGIIVIAGGKLTTYRRMAKEATDRVVEWLGDRGDAALEGRHIKPCRTKNRPLPGAQGMEIHGHRGVEAIADKLVHSAGLAARVAQHLAQTYGPRADSGGGRGGGVGEPRLLERRAPDLPYLWAEVDHAVEVDLARTLDDVLARRIPLVLRARDQGLGVAARAAERMGSRLGWDAAERERQ